MACCYIAASMIGFLVHSCEALDLSIGIRYNDASQTAHSPSSGEHHITKDSDEGLDAGFSIVSIEGMICAACTGTVERALREVKGVNHALVSLTLQEARVFHDQSVHDADLIAAVEAAGYGANLGARKGLQRVDSLMHTRELDDLRSSLRGLGIYSTLIFGLGKGADWVGLGGLLFWSPLSMLRSWTLLVVASIAAARHGSWIFQAAWTAGLKGRANMNTLIALSTALSLVVALATVLHSTSAQQGVILDLDAVVGVLLIVAGGRYMDLVSRRRATQTFAGLYTLLRDTQTARLATLGDHKVPAAAVRQGDEIIIAPYSIIPCDSYVLSGESHVNEAVLTGETLPQTKRAGDVLVAGSRNGPGRLVAAVTQPAPTASFLARLLQQIETALAAKTPTESRIDFITQYFVTAIMAIAVVAGVHCLLTMRDNSYLNAGRKVATILAAACPCALGLAAPCAVMAAIDVAWQSGLLLLHGGDTLDQVQHVTDVIMDKTGTLTCASFSVTQQDIAKAWMATDDFSDLAVLVCAVEEKALDAHALSLAVFRHFFPATGDRWKRYRAWGGVHNLTTVVGKGVTCDVNLGDESWHRIVVGSLEFLCERRMRMTSLALPSSRSASGSEVFVGVDGEFAARLTLQDTVRTDAKTTITALEERGLHVTMLTGDNTAEAERISNELGIEVLASHASPSAKADHITKIQAGGARVLMVGDGMNDGPALAAADVGVMMGHDNRCFSSGGSVLILQSELSGLLTLLDIASSTTKQISANVAWALAYNIIAVGLAIGLGAPLGLRLSPTMAAMMMSASSVFITVQGLVFRKRLASVHCKGETGLAWDF